MAHMDLKQRRRAKMEQLIKEEENGNAAAFARTVGTDPAYIYQIRSDQTGRDIGDDLARRIESAYKKPSGWMDLMPAEAIYSDISPKAYKLAKAWDKLPPCAQETVLHSLAWAAKREQDNQKDWLVDLIGEDLLKEFQDTPPPNQDR